MLRDIPVPVTWQDKFAKTRYSKSRSHEAVKFTFAAQHCTWIILKLKKIKLSPIIDPFPNSK